MSYKLTMLVAQVIESWVLKHTTEPWRPSLRPKVEVYIIIYKSIFSLAGKEGGRGPCPPCKGHAESKGKS